ncbi:hypothetical protein [Alkalihalobacterium bogoriense]|uniref:hypothetical protein n=1 Tax=Alkalihalobacterium bogoriense TaxID=246272 RepID=UPI00047A2263|nr:hypothetical protein [Alkalihalobacterium bogoriense]
MVEVGIVVFSLLVIVLLISLKKRNRAKLHVIRKEPARNRTQVSKINKRKEQLDISKLAVDQEHYLFLEALVEGRITEAEYDKWAHSRKHEGQEVFRMLLRRPYEVRKL